MRWDKCEVRWDKCVTSVSSTPTYLPVSTYGTHAYIQDGIRTKYHKQRIEKIHETYALASEQAARMEFLGASDTG